MLSSMDGRRSRDQGPIGVAKGYRCRPKTISSKRQACAGSPGRKPTARTSSFTLAVQLSHMGFAGAVRVPLSLVSLAPGLQILLLIELICASPFGILKNERGSAWQPLDG